uniref:Uncharacterized protein n=2 Tax=Colletotrichum fructicola (strain Nara gc5) TaxID=1213859 RepID=L2FRI6_COLFN
MMITPSIVTVLWATALVGSVASVPLEPRQGGCCASTSGGKSASTSGGNSASTSQAGRITIGYRTVHPDQARAYNREHRLVYNPGLTRGAAQIGKGVYLTPGPGQWVGNPGDWHCHVTANKKAVENVLKAWIPENTWWNINKQYEWAAKQTVNKVKVDDEAFNRALRMSKIDKTDDPGVKFAKGAKQLLIPSDLVNDRDLDIQVDCKKEWKRLPDNVVVDYRSWKKNVIGKPQ